MDIDKDKLLNEMKKRIAISNYNFEQENEILNSHIFPNQFENWRRYIMNKKKLLNIASIFAIALILIGTSTGIYAKRQWDIGFKEYQNREYEIGLATIKDAQDSGYVQNIEMDYIVQDNIGVKLDSMLITDEYFEATINFKFPENMEINTESFSYGYAIYDNEKNIYSICSRPNFGKNEKIDKYTPYMLKEIGIKYDKNNIYSLLLSETSGIQNIVAQNHSLLSKIVINTSKGLPKSKKLYVRINNLGYTMTEISDNSNIDNIQENFDVSNSEWIFEIDIPERFYERTTTELALKDNIENLEIEKIAVSEIGLVIKGTLKGFDEILKSAPTPNEETNLRNKTIYITDENGNKYYENTAGLVGNKDWFRMNFEITKNMLNQKLFLNIKIGEQLYISELIVK